MNADDIITFCLYLMQKRSGGGGGRGKQQKCGGSCAGGGKQKLSRTQITGLWNRGKSSGVICMI